MRGVPVVYVAAVVTTPEDDAEAFCTSPYGVVPVLSSIWGALSAEPVKELKAVNCIGLLTLQRFSFVLTWVPVCVPVTTARLSLMTFEEEEVAARTMMTMTASPTKRCQGFVLAALDLIPPFIMVEFMKSIIRFHRIRVDSDLSNLRV